MALTTGQQAATSREFVDEVLGGETCQFTKAQIRAAAVAVDDWLTANAAGLNAALPQPFRGAATTQQKAGLLILVARRRWGV